MSRAKREADSYNSGDVYKNSTNLQKRFWHVFSSPNSQLLEEYFENYIINNVNNSDILDYGCLYGKLCEKLSKFNPKSLTGIDISDIAIGLAEEKYGHLANFLVMDGHSMNFKSNSFDLIIGRAILHHLDWEIAIKEIHRVLKPGGTAIFVEPLSDNPISKLIRKLTPKSRTKDEKPISKSQIIFADNIFKRNDHYFANMFTVPVAMITSKLTNNPKNIALKFTNLIDILISKTFFKYNMRIVALVWSKEKTN